MPGLLKPQHKRAPRSINFTRMFTEKNTLKFILFLSCGSKFLHRRMKYVLLVFPSISSELTLEFKWQPSCKLMASWTKDPPHLSILCLKTFPKPQDLDQLQAGQTKKRREVNAPGKNLQLTRDTCTSSLSFRGTILRSITHEGLSPMACNSKRLSDSSCIRFSSSCLTLTTLLPTK